MNIATIAFELKAAQDELDAAKRSVDRIPALTDRVSDLESALIESAKGKSVDIGTSTPEPNATDDLQFLAPREADEFETAFQEGDTDPADAVLEAVKALDDEPDGNMTSALPNGGLPGNLY